MGCRFMIMNLVELRKNNWMPRKTADAGPKKLDEIKKDMQKEQMENQNVSSVTGGVRIAYGRTRHQSIIDCICRRRWRTSVSTLVRTDMEWEEEEDRWEEEEDMETIRREWSSRGIHRIQEEPRMKECRR